MKKNYLKAILLISFTLLTLSGLGAGIYMQVQVTKLTTHYSVYKLESKSYELVKKRPNFWVKLDDISHVGKWAIIISEDWAFYDHSGLDFNQIEDVIKESIEEGRLVRGASTITQQVAKNLMLSNDRTITRKAFEAVYTVLIERNLSKDQILEHYLNLVELGKNIYGIKQASKYYFKKAPQALSAKEGAFLAMLLPSPLRYAQSYNEGRLTDFASEQVSSILLKMRQAKIINEEERLNAEAEVLPFALVNHFDDDLFSLENESY